MKPVIMPPYFFLYIGFFQLMNAVDKFVVYDDIKDRVNVLGNPARQMRQNTEKRVFKK